MKAAVINVMPYAIGCAMSKSVKHEPYEYLREPLKFDGKEKTAQITNEEDMYKQEFEFMKMLP